MSASAERTPDSFLAGLNEPQLEAVTHQGGHCLVLAGAGSGKTRVLTHRIAWLVSVRGIDPAEVCAVTFTNKAAAEMRRRVRRLLRDAGARAGGAADGHVWLSTFHSLGLRLLREWAGEGHAGPGIPRPGFAIYDRDASLAVWRRCQSRLRISPREYDPGRLMSRCSRAVNQLHDPAAWDSHERGWEQRIAARIWKLYRAEMETANAVDFDDLLHRPLQALTHDPALREAMAGRFAHLLIDEYQDTNRLQYRLVQALLGPSTELLVVGDEDQSIYRWRGADLNNVLDFQSDFPGATVIRLEQNYRSTQPILSAAGSLVARNRQRLGKTLWTELEGGDRPRFVQCATDREEALWVAKKVTEDELDPAATAVLYRTNAQSRLFEETFLAKSIPHRVVGGPRFFARREIRDVLAYLQLLVRPDDVAFGRAIAAPSRGVGPRTLAAIAAIEDGMSNAATIETIAAGDDAEAVLRRAGCAPGAIAGLIAFAGLLAELRALATACSLDELIRATIERSGYDRLLDTERDGDDRRANLDELITAAREGVGAATDPAASDAGAAATDPGAAAGGAGSGRGGPDTLGRLRAFLDRLALLTDGDADRGSADGVRLMTVHAAKGLEFDNVFLAGMEEELFPHATAIAEGDVEEERRLCYVGMTRARRRLFLSAARSRQLRGRERWQEPSRFIAEIDPQHLEVRDWVNPRAVGSQGYAPSAFTGVGGRTGQRRRARAARHRGGGRKQPRTAPVKLAPGQPTRPAAAGELTEGAVVFHPMFGAGQITEATGAGERQKLKIRFNDAGTKTVIAAFAKLEVPE